MTRLPASWIAFTTSKKAAVKPNSSRRTLAMSTTTSERVEAWSLSSAIWLALAAESTPFSSKPASGAAGAGPALAAGGAFAAFGPPALSAGGQVAFAAVVEGKAVPGGVFVATGDRIQMVVAAGEDTPIGGIFAKFSERIGLNDAGVIAFHGILKFAPVEAAIFVVESGRTRAISRLGDPAPGGGTIAHFGPWPSVGSTGAVAFAASIESGSTSVAILLADATGLTQIVAVGDTLPGGDRIASLTLYPVVSVGPRGHVTFAVAPTATGEGPEGLFVAQPAPGR